MIINLAGLASANYFYLSVLFNKSMTHLQMELRKRVLVTGAAHRLGAEICHQFAHRGWEILLHYQNSRQAAEQLCHQLIQQGVPATPIMADLSCVQSRLEMLTLIQEKWGYIHAIVNNASMFYPDQGRDYSEEVALQQLKVNLLAPLDLAKALATTISPPEGQDACVVHILDQKVMNLNPDYFSYTVSKLALERCVQLQAQALAPKVRVCGVAPGLMYLSGDQSQDNFDKASKANLLKKPINPADVAKTCEFLVSNPSITGTTLAVDNGQHLVPSPRDIMFVVDDLLKDEQK